MFSQTLVQGLNSLPDRPWREKRNGKGITVAWLAEQLQPYGIYPAMMRIGIPLPFSVRRSSHVIVYFAACACRMRAGASPGSLR